MISLGYCPLKSTDQTQTDDPQELWDQERRRTWLEVIKEGGICDGNVEKLQLLKAPLLLTTFLVPSPFAHTYLAEDPSTRIRIFLNPQIFLCRLENFHVHTYLYSNRIGPSTPFRVHSQFVKWFRWRTVCRAKVKVDKTSTDSVELLPRLAKTAVANWFRRRSFAVLNSSVRFGTWARVERRLNRA